MDATAKIIRLPRIRELVGLGKTTIYAQIKFGDFPPPIKLGFASGWLEREIQDWIEKKARAAWDS